MSAFDIRKLLVSTSVLIGATTLAFTPLAFAQDADDQEEVEIEEITVTGSRIKRAGVDTFYPAISIGVEELEDGAFTNIADALNQIPAFGTPDATPLGPQLAFSVGQNFVDFLGLGSQRTLTLVNGRRFVSANTPSLFGESGGLQVDFNVLPVALVERIETIGVGGAPIYGSDAIAGTINVIMKDRFEGVEMTLQTGTSDKKDADFTKASLVAGANFSNGRGNVTVSLETSKQDGLFLNARPRYTRNDPGFMGEETRDPDDPDSDSVRRIYYDQHVQLFAEGGSISGPIGLFIPSRGTGFIWGDLDDGVFYQFDGNSNLVPFRPGVACGGSSAFFACRGQNPDDPDHDGPDFFDNVAQIQSPLQRNVFTARMNYDLTDRVTFHSDVLFADTWADELTNQGGFQTFAFPGTSGALTFQSDNPFLPQQAQDILTANGLTEFVLHRFNNDIIDPSNSRKQFLWQATAGLEGDFEAGNRDFFWSAFVSRGESNGQTRKEGIVDGRFLNAIDVRRLTDADFVDDNGTPLDPSDDITLTTELDLLNISGTTSAGVGDIICESVYQEAIGNGGGLSGSGVTDLDLPYVQGCVPLNLFGKGVRSDAARDWVTGQQMTQTDLEQTVFNVNFGGDLIELPAGTLAFNIGYERREEEAAFVGGIGSSVPLTRSNPFDPTGGRYKTDEFYGEVVVPLFSSKMGVPGLELLELNGAVREIDNDLAGSATVWTTGIRWAPFTDVSFRANYTESLRNPSLVELFAPVTQVFDFASDPCDRRFVDDGPVPATRLANCAADIANYDPDTFTSNIVNATVIGSSGGNTNLINEEAKSYSIGMTFEPRFMENFLFTVDYVNIEISDAIVNLDTTQLMQACYDSSTFPAPPLGDGTLPCSSFTRNAIGQVIDFNQGQANASLFKFESLQMGINYDIEVATLLGEVSDSMGARSLGDFSTRIRLDHPINRRISVIGEPNSNTLGGFGDPDWSGTFDFIWSGENARVFYRLIWQDEALLSPSGGSLYEANGKRITRTDARFMTNVSLSYRLAEFFPGAPNETLIQLSINNLYDREPDLIQEAAGHFGSAELFGRTYSLTIKGIY